MIEDMFASRSKAGAINVRLALKTTQKRTSTNTKYVTKMQALGDKMAATGKPLDDEDLIAYIVNGLDADYDPVVESQVARAEPVT
ncbi:hypothetical protein E2562_037828 [Oryza meyeriana var. granulata]|uniref:Uncharacterized protein n=1 Tax=Oryza meyeriana var. granulata TaxID=110450 RepID=A0A6G1DT65_9ORYZ|nr:hypothetical protein E2562_037828 [Oryza meyeriana var. granulata]